MKKFYFLILAIAISVFISCDQELLRPDPIPDPSKFATNQTVLEEFRINSIAFDDVGSAWIGTDKGLFHYSTTHSILYNSLNSNIQTGIGDIAIDSKNNIWMAAKGWFSLNRYAMFSFRRFNWFYLVGYYT